MKRGIKFLTTLALVVAVAWVAPAPAEASCTFSSLIGSNGFAQAAGDPAPSALNTAGFIGGTVWELTKGNPADGAGNDLNSAIGGDPVGADRPFIQENAVVGGKGMRWDWINGGTDGCLSSGIAGSGQMGAYLEDSLGNYAVLAVQGTTTAPARHNFDRVVTGEPGNAVPFKPKSLVPAISVTSIVDDFSVVADVEGVTASVNCFDDGVADCNLVVNTGTQLIRESDNAPVPGCGSTGCNGVALNRDESYCWDTDAKVVASSTEGPRVCQGGVFNGQFCGPVADPSGFCAVFAGVCPPGAVIVVPWDTIPKGCVLIAGPTVSDVVLTTPAAKNANFVRLRWQAEQFTITHFEIIGKRPNGTELNLGQTLRQGNNDGSLQSYEVILSRGDVQGSKSFAVRTFLTDGTSFDSQF